ncbi:MAG: glutamate mutase L [Bradymonadales bacterium]|nr:glutamate mutase L [Bradymonadales bacterium]
MTGIDVVVVEVGSTLTKAMAIANLGAGKATLAARAEALTTVDQGDVVAGVDRALAELASRLGPGHSLPKKVLACSSAAGGLRMAAVGLAPDMTVRAAREACLGAGAVLRFVHGGKLKDRHLAELEREKPNVILLAGGTDGGDEETILYNAHRIAGCRLPVPLVYAGNAACAPEALASLERYPGPVEVVENVYPNIDLLNVLPARRKIQELFSRHIVSAPGMARLRERVEGTVLPVPAAVLRSAELLADRGEEVLVIDAGGATTDVHSVTNGDPQRAHLLTEPQPRSKRTVEGDLGVYHNADSVRREMEATARPPDLGYLKPLPQAGEEVTLSMALGRAAVLIALDRHAGRVVSRYTATGRVDSMVGKDLTAITLIVGTGGVLCRLPGGSDILRAICRPFDGIRLFPTPGARIALDQDYILSSAGVLATVSEADSLSLIDASLAGRES